MAWVEQGIGALEVGAVPDAQSISQAVYFTMAGGCRQRYAVEVIADDALTCLERLWSCLLYTSINFFFIEKLLRFM